MSEAIEPGFIYRKQARLNPKHCKKLYQIEDLMIQSKIRKVRNLENNEILIT